MAKRRTIKTVQQAFFDPVTNNAYRQDLSFYKRSFILAPPYWAGLPTARFKHFIWTPLPFSKISTSKLNGVEGLYLFVLKPNICNAPFINYLMYIGETDNLKRRFGEYLNKIGNPKSPQYKMFTLIDDYPDNLEFYFAEFPGMDATTRKAREGELLTAFMPPINDRYPALVDRLVKQTYSK